MTVSQITQLTQAATTQLNFRQMTGEILEWNPDLSPQMAKRFLNNAYRRIVDFRLWYGLLVAGQVTVPNNYTAGQVTVTQDSTTITGIGMNWDQTMVGRQFRVGFSTPIYSIKTVNSPTSLYLNIPWGSASQNGVSYMIFQNIVSFGPNVKRILACVNQRQGYRLKLNMPQDVLNIYDTWRTTTGWTFLVANYAPSADGQPQFELYPAPTFQQSFPFLVYVQPPDMVKDVDFPYTFIRSDLLVMGAIPDALLFRGKNSKYYDPQTAQTFQGRFNEEIIKMGRNDDNLYPKDLMWEYSRYPFTQYGADFYQSHDVDSMFL